MCVSLALTRKIIIITTIAVAAISCKRGSLQAVLYVFHSRGQHKVFAARKCYCVCTREQQDECHQSIKPGRGNFREIQTTWAASDARVLCANAANLSGGTRVGTPRDCDHSAHSAPETHDLGNSSQSWPKSSRSLRGAGGWSPTSDRPAETF